MLRTRLSLCLGALLFVIGLLAATSTPAAAFTDPVSVLALMGHDTAVMAQHALGTLQAQLSVVTDGLTSSGAVLAGSYVITIKGSGKHDEGNPVDADKIARDTVLTLQQLGHSVSEASFELPGTKTKPVDLLAAPAPPAASA